jgi:hypothetical protein
MLHSSQPRAVVLPLSQQQDLVLVASALLQSSFVLHSTTSLKAQLLDLLVLLSAPRSPDAGISAHQHLNCVHYTAQLALQQQQDLRALQAAGWWVAGLARLAAMPACRFFKARQQYMIEMCCCTPDISGSLAICKCD